MLDILLKRIARKATYTIGKLFINGVYVCDTLEDRDRLHFGESKVYGKTAIPCGTYKVNLHSYSPKFGNKEPYRSLSNGLVPLIENVPFFEGIRIHIGNTQDDTFGCILVGKNSVVGKVLRSRDTYELLEKRYFAKARRENDTARITII